VRYLSVSCVDDLKKRFLPEFILRVAEGVEMTFLDLGNSPLISTPYVKTNYCEANRLYQN